MEKDKQTLKNFIQGSSLFLGCLLIQKEINKCVAIHEKISTDSRRILTGCSPWICRVLNLLFSLVSQVCDYFIIDVFLFEASGGKIKKSYQYRRIQSHYTNHYQQENCLDLDSKARVNTITNIFSVFQA